MDDRRHPKWLCAVGGVWSCVASVHCFFSRDFFLLLCGVMLALASAGAFMNLFDEKEAKR